MKHRGCFNWNLNKFDKKIVPLLGFGSGPINHDVVGIRIHSRVVEIVHTILQQNGAADDNSLALASAIIGSKYRLGTFGPVLSVG